jgi:hypothetical protein
VIYFYTKAQSRASIAANQATLQVFVTKQKIENAKMRKMQKTMTTTYLMHNGTHSKSICKWIIDLESTKHMILRRATFNPKEVIPSRNVHLDDDNVVKAIGISIIAKAIIRSKIN